MGSPDKEPSTAAGDRRDDRRAGTFKPASLCPVAGSLDVTVENVSEGGLFATLDGSLQFRIQIVGEAEPRRVALVRSQALPDGRTGLGFKFMGPDEMRGAR